MLECRFPFSNYPHLKEREHCTYHQMICKLSSLPPPMDRMPSAEEDKDWNMKKKKKNTGGGGELLENTWVAVE